MRSVGKGQTTDLAACAISATIRHRATSVNPWLANACAPVCTNHAINRRCLFASVGYAGQTGKVPKGGLP
jgi:hypothetical protein